MQNVEASSLPPLDLKNYDPNPRVLAFDLGGSHVSAAIVERTGKLHSRVWTCSIPDAAEADTIIEAFRRVATQALDQSRSEVHAVVVATPGPFDYENGVSLMAHKHASLNAVNLRHRLSVALGFDQASFTFVNDAVAFARGEIEGAQLKTFPRICVLTLGTGLGSAFCIDGEIRSEGHGIPRGGEMYDLSWGDGMVEDRISTRWLIQAYLSATGNLLSVRAIAERAPTDEAARTVFFEFGTTLGAVLDQYLSDFKPKALLIGGGIARSAHLFLPAMSEAIQSIAPNVVVSRLFEDAALLGGAYLAFAKLSSRT